MFATSARSRSGRKGMSLDGRRQSRLSAPGRKAWDVVRELNSKIDPFCPESLLFQPELVVRDFEDFSCLEGHDFGYILGLGDGARIFLHGLRAMRAIVATHMAECMTTMR